MTSEQPSREKADGSLVEPAAGGGDRLTLVWNGLAELTTRLDGTEDAVAAALDTLTAAVADLKTQLTALLAKEREKDVPPRRWAARATRKDWDQLVVWVDELDARAIHCSATTPSRRAGPRTPASSRTSPACTMPGRSRSSTTNSANRPAATTSPPGTTGGCGPACAA